MAWCCPERCAGLDAVVPPSTVKVDGVDRPVLLEQLRQRKELTAAYAMWGVGGVFGTHHFYMDRLVHGCLALWSLNFVFVGWVADAFLMPIYVRWANVGTSRVAVCDGVAVRVCWRLPPLIIFIFVAFGTILVQGPRLVQEWGFLDVDQELASTSGNPYEMLGISRHATVSEAKAAFEGKKEELHLRCKVNCTVKFGDLFRAMEYVVSHGGQRPERKKRGKGADAHRSRDQEWDNWSSNLGKQWRIIIAHAKDSFQASEASQAEPSTDEL